MSPEAASLLQPLLARFCRWRGRLVQASTSTPARGSPRRGQPRGVIEAGGG